MKSRNPFPVFAVCLGLVILAFAQAPGQTVVDTKLDLSENPAGFLGRALHLWNASAGFGQVENQSYGYFVPMGPFFLAGDAIGLPPWIVQRLWLALLLIVGYLGFLFFIRALRVGTIPAQHVAALAWALCPRVITTVGPISSEILSLVALPWVMLPLMRPDRQRTAARPAVLSALAILAIGGINGAVVIASMVLPLIWLVSGARDRFGRRLLAWWSLFGAVAIMWWLSLLVITSRYLGEFLTRSESAAATSSRISAWHAFRGADHWVAAVSIQGEPWWQAAWYVLGSPLGMASTAVICVAGLAGLIRSDMPERFRWVAIALVGFTFLTLGYAGEFGPWADSLWRSLLDGPLAAFRNVHKFDPVLRLPLIVGLAHLIGVVQLRLARRIAEKQLARNNFSRSSYALMRAVTSVVTLAGLAGVGLVAKPAFTGDLATGHEFGNIPTYWHQAAEWLKQNAKGSAHLVPGSGFGEYTWGRTYDEPLQPLSAVPWSVRNQVPMGEPGSVRWMDTIESVLASGQGSPALGKFLARTGVSHVVARHDMQWWRTGAARPAVVHQALARSGGIRKVAAFGPQRASSALGAPEVSGYDLDAGLPAVEIYEDTEPGLSPVSLYDADALAAVSGGPEAILGLLEAEMLRAGTPVVLSGESGAPPASRWFTSDTLQRREVHIGRVHDASSAVMSLEDEYRIEYRAQPYEMFSSDHQTIAQYAGVSSITASSSAGYADSVGPTRTENSPFAAFDNDPRTYWQSSVFGSPVGQWIDIEFESPVPAESVTIQFFALGAIEPPVTKVAIQTDTGTLLYAVAPGNEPQKFATASVLTRKLRVIIVDMAPHVIAQAAIREISLPGVTVGRSLRLPDDAPASVAGQAPQGIVLSQRPPSGACVLYQDSLRCDPALLSDVDESTFDRRFALGSESAYEVTGTMVLRPGQSAQGAIGRSAGPLSAEVSSTFAGEPLVPARNLFDGDRLTSWAADPLDTEPVIRYRWQGKRVIKELRFEPSPGRFAATPTEVTIFSPDGTRVVKLDRPGVHEFEALETDHLEVRMTKTRDVVSIDPVSGRSAKLPPGMAEMSFPALRDLVSAVDPKARFTLPCGEGPVIVVNGKNVQTSAEGLVADVLNRRPVKFTACGELLLSAGAHRLSADSWQGFAVTSLFMRRPGATSVNDVVAPRIRTWTATNRSVDISAGRQSLLLLRQNFNHGWVAVLNGQELKPVRLEGWLQGWIVPQGAGGTVHLRYAPDGIYRTALAIGAGLSGLLLILGLTLAFAKLRLRPGPRHEFNPAADALWLRLIPATLIVVAGTAGGIAGLAVGLTVFAVKVKWGRTAVAVSAVVLLAAASGVAVGQASGTGGLVQLLATASAGLLASTTVFGKPKS